jgi:hypothetical protein
VGFVVTGFEAASNAKGNLNSQRKVLSISSCKLNIPYISIHIIVTFKFEWKDPKTCIKAMSAMFRSIDVLFMAL